MGPGNQNQSPVLRIVRDGVLLYANSASESFLTEWACKSGEKVPTSWRKMISKALVSDKEKRVEIERTVKVCSFEIAPLRSSLLKTRRIRAEYSHNNWY